MKKTEQTDSGILRKKRYQQPKIYVTNIEMENGIASGSNNVILPGGGNMNQEWESSDQQSEQNWD